MRKKDMLYPYRDGICVYEYVTVNGLKQYIQIRGKKTTNPLLLVIHGGPGGALSGLAHVMQQQWEEKFTVVNFDQRNSGKTYLANKEKAYEIGNTGTIEDYLRDIKEIIIYLHTKYEFQKVYLMGFSWGSIIGAEYARKYADDVAAYIGVGQMVNFEKGFKFVCEKALKKAEEKNCKKDVQKLQFFIDEYPKESAMSESRMKAIRAFAMLANKYLVKHAKPFPVGAILMSPFLKYKEKQALFLTDIKLYQETYKSMFSYDFTTYMEYKVPLVFISGEEDVNCPVELLEKTMETIHAPSKKLIKIKDASHMCFYDNPEEFYKALLEILRK